MPESPSFLIRKERRDEAVATLMILRDLDNSTVEKEIEKITSQHGIHKKGSFKQLFCNRINRRAVFIAYGLRTIQQFAGTTALTFYCKTIFEESGDVLSSKVSSLIYFSLQLIVAFCMIFIVDLVGRKPLLLVSIIGTSTSLFLLGGYLFIKDHSDIDITSIKFLPVITLLSNVVFFSIGIRNVPLIIMSEIFSPSIKSLALCYGTIYYSILAFSLAKLFFITNETFGMYASFLLYGSLTLSSIFFVIYFIPETKGLTLDEIQKLLSDHSHSQSTEDREL